MKDDDDKKTADFWGTVGGIIVILLILGAIGSAFEFVSDKWKKRSNAKEYCSETHRVLNAKTDYAAKKAYKACVSNY